MAPASAPETVLSCTRNAYFLQNVCSRLRKTPNWETRLADQAPTQHPDGWTGTQNSASWPGPGSQVAPQNRCSHARETPTFSKRRAPAYAKHYFPHFDPCRGDHGDPLAEPSWAARPKRKTCRPKLLTWFRYVNSCGRLFGSSECSGNGALVHAKRLVSPKCVLPST